MQIDEKTVRKIARLARLQLTTPEVENMQNSLSQIFTWIEQLNEVDTQGIEPLFNVTLEQMPMQEDIVNDGNYVKAVLANAPEVALNMFSVPKVVE
jgi:aspartyl-tRNA(Asn)/glutamyl-tRNA(Gln) amidotransferase subunit C